jgi:hypothetical protein
VLRKYPKTSWRVKNVFGNFLLLISAYGSLLSVMSPVAIARVNNIGQVIYGNPTWMQMSDHLGVDEDFPKESLVELVHPDDRQTMYELWKDALENIKQIAFELRWGTRDRFLWGMGELVPEIVNEEVLKYVGSYLSTFSTEGLSLY